MKKYKCNVCKGMLDAGMCQSGIIIEGETFAAHVGCADEWMEREIEVWRVTSPGNGSYLERIPENVTQMLKEMSDDSEYVIKKERITQGRYNSLPEFGGF